MCDKLNFLKNMLQLKKLSFPLILGIGKLITDTCKSFTIYTETESFMKEQLYTIPLNDAVNAQDECPFCFIERNIEQDLLDFVLGSLVFLYGSGYP